jgi:hypothetical protein
VLKVNELQREISSRTIGRAERTTTSGNYASNAHTKAERSQELNACLGIRLPAEVALSPHQFVSHCLTPPCPEQVPVWCVLNE